MYSIHTLCYGGGGGLRQKNTCRQIPLLIFLRKADILGLVIDIWSMMWTTDGNPVLMNYTGTKTKCRHLKKLTYTETLLQVFICLRRPPLQGFC
jgi:hypothetical protein